MALPLVNGGIVPSANRISGGTFNQATTNGWEVGFGGEVQSSRTMAKAANAPVPAWQKEVLTFVAAGSAAMLEFMANGTPGNQPPTALLSAISVTPQDTPPEPPTGVPSPLGVLGCGAAFAFSRRLRRRLGARR
jgi:hypothetical protein